MKLPWISFCLHMQKTSPLSNGIVPLLSQQLGFQAVYHLPKNR